MEISSYKNLNIRLTALIIAVVSAITFTAFADTKENSAVSDTSLSQMSRGSGIIEISSGVTSRDPQGFIWMDIESIRNEIDTLEINRYDEEINSEAYSVPVAYFDKEKFFEIIEIVKSYDWSEHKEYINALELKASKITVIGNNTVYTYLVFGKNGNGKSFIWSFYDHMIAYPPEEDFTYIEKLLSE